ncbi:MAG: gliding motility-associated C-terminal domain-containing protein [Bacteroidetes bacterium]|nr:gliding motility-associated C-terminal domain-containing protein [Bacteroidota bacterium]
MLDSNASIVKLNKTFKLSLEDGEFLKGIRTVSESKNIYSAIIIEKNTNSPKAITDYLLLLKIDYTTGILLSEVKYLFNDQLIYSDGVHENIFANGLLYENFNFKITEDNMLVIAGRKATNSFDNNRFFVLKCNKDLSISNYFIYKYPQSLSFFYSEDVATLPYISTGGNVLFSNIKDSSKIGISTNNCYYFLTDTSLNLLLNRKQNITETGLNTDGFRLNVVPYLKNNDVGELIYHTYYSQHDSVLHIVNISKDISENTCMGNVSDVDIVIEKPAYIKLPPPEIFNIASPTFILTPYTLISQGEIIEERKFCKQASICDTLKLKGKSDYCLSSPFATFTVYKNPACLRKVKWIVDTTAIKITSIPNDTTVNIKFLKPYHGYISTTFEGCTLKDSIFINVYPVAPWLFLGNDTTICPGKSILLNAGDGFKSYKWQDNSSFQTFSVTTPGDYFVEVTDSCDNIFRDSLIIYPAPVFQLVYPSTLCRYDTASITLNNTLKNYNWFPSNSALIENNILKLFPLSSTVYNISAELFNGCILSDTLLVKVEACPEYIYFPTAFTPNGDGKNDYFKPIVSGSFKQYSFSIFNRFGQKIFSTQNINEGWDGKLHGAYQDTDTYIWICTFRFRNEELKFRKGTVVLVR